MISFSAVTPHPPVIIPGVASVSQSAQVKKTIDSMRELKFLFERSKTDAAVVISPHSPYGEKFFYLNTANPLEGDLIQFGLDKEYLYNNDLKLALEIKNQADKNNIPLQFHKSFLDHGVLVPLHYLLGNSMAKVVILSLSGLSLKKHYEFGSVVGEVLAKERRKIAIIASGDLSHRLTSDAPAGYEPLAKKFDRTVRILLKNRRDKDVLNINPILIEKAGECGLKSITILLGSMSKRDWNFHELSYEGPFGVGYLVGYFA